MYGKIAEHDEGERDAVVGLALGRRAQTMPSPIRVNTARRRRLPRSQVRPTQLAHQNQRSGRRQMTRAKATTKAKAIWMPGKERPAASRLVIQRPLPAKPHHMNTGKDTKPPAGQPIRQTAEGLDHRFLRSQPRVIGPGSPRKARPRRSEYNLTTHPEGLGIGHNGNDSNRALQIHTAAG